ncbi:hypothetical protein BIU82_11735 [Arthrobacter sp. SW1]|uniref:sigma-70 family RNA polymerase sigma factor n=1 Tax=Arthrobacter sp. SW1 TaxID=1920889 RepID=UPI000877CBB0|nr:sigma-70 family RNA polymerase sigma factor [Arthrobacter sp. SW1]OFI36746.1 hypothetical protein BIU82_11735 [Arthrobacter sp. SW1]
MGAHQSELSPTVGDPHLIAEVRAGNVGAFDDLYRRHRGIALAVATAQTDNASDADDVVAEAFAAVFSSLKEGKGPDEFFRAYLLTVVRRMAHLRNRQAACTIPGHDGDLDAAIDQTDPVVSAFESTTMAKAFKTLPERWQAVLWYMDVEQMKPAAVAALIGSSANGASSLLLRAREGLRQAYLQHHITVSDTDPCAGYAKQLGKYARNKLSRSAAVKLEAHLAGCAKCTALLADLSDIQSSMRAAILPLLTGLAVDTAQRSGVIPLASAPATASSVLPWAVPMSIKAAAAALVLGSAALTATTLLSTAGGVPPSSAPTVTAPLPESLFQTQPPGSPPNRPSPTGTPAPVDPAPQIPLPPITVPDPLPTPQEQSPRNPQTAAPVLPRPTTPSHSPESTPIPSTSPTPETTSPPVTPPAEALVRADFTMIDDPVASQKELRPVFRLRDGYNPQSVTVSFELSSEVHFIPGKVQAPENWACTEDPDGRRISCTSSTIPAPEMAFTLGISGLETGEHATLYSLFTGGGQDHVPFRHSFP